MELLKTNEIAGIDKDSQEYLKEFIKKNNCKKILEIGMADGMSSIAILSALEEIEGTSLTSIDPYQKTFWSSNGLKNIEKMNLQKKHIFNDNFDYIALPELVKNNEKYDLIFVDGSHIYDHVILNNFYADILLKVNGYLVNDDYWMPAIKKAYSYIKNNYPHYEEIETHKRFAPILKKKKEKEYLGWDYFTPF